MKPADYKWTSPRKRPMGVAEPIAQAEYERRGYDVQPQSAQHFFDYTVNGVRVDVKLSRELVGRTGQFLTVPFTPWPDHAERFDVAHVVCICDDHYGLRHFIIPVGELKFGGYAASINPGNECYAKFEDAWHLLEGAV